MEESKQIHDDESAATETSGGDESTGRRHKTLKGRIKRAMETEPAQNHANSLLSAATALASLGTGTPPNDETAAAPSDSATAIAPKVSEGGDANGAKKLPSRLENDVPMTFPQKLMEVLSNTEIADVITWLPHGKGFIILQKRKFASDIMPQYFKHSKFTSFTRKLNRWGFTRITRGPETGAYYHKFFQRGNHLLCMQMHCQSTKAPTGNTNMMSAGMSPRSAAMDSPCVMTAMTSLRLDEAIPPMPSLMSRDSGGSVQFPTFGTAHAPPASPAQNGGPNNDMMRMQMSQENVTQSRSVLERAFIRQQQLLQEEQRFRMMTNQRQQQEFLARQQQHEQQHLQNSGQQFQTQRRTNGSQSMRVANMLGLNTTSSRQHPLVIQAALNALQSCNDRAYLTMLMTKEHEQAKAEAAAGNGMMSQAEIQSRVHAAMQAQIRQLEMYNREQGDGREDSPHQQQQHRQPILRSDVNMAVGLKKSTPLVTQNHVAQLHREINQQHGFMPSDADPSYPQGRPSSSVRRPRGVRRASAA